MDHTNTTIIYATIDGEFLKLVDIGGIPFQIGFSLLRNPAIGAFPFMESPLKSLDISNLIQDDPGPSEYGWLTL